MLGRSIGVALKAAARAEIVAVHSVARRQGIEVSVAAVDPSFSYETHGPFDTQRMKALFDVGFEEVQPLATSLSPDRRRPYGLVTDFSAIGAAHDKIPRVAEGEHEIEYRGVRRGEFFPALRAKSLDRILVGFECFQREGIECGPWGGFRRNRH